MNFRNRTPQHFEKFHDPTLLKCTGTLTDLHHRFPSLPPVSFIMGALIGDFIKPKSSSAWAPPLLLLFIFLAILSFQFSSKSVFPIGLISSGPGHDHDDPRKTCAGFFGHVALLPRRKVVMSITDFGGVGDGKTSNTETFRKAIRYMQGFGDKGGSQLNVPKGKWLTGSFNLTSNFTLFLQHGALILGSQACQIFFKIFLTVNIFTLFTFY